MLDNKRLFMVLKKIGIAVAWIWSTISFFVLFGINVSALFELPPQYPGTPFKVWIFAFCCSMLFVFGCAIFGYLFGNLVTRKKKDGDQ